MSLDHIAAFGCFWMALIACLAHAVTGPRQPSWMNLPEHVRYGFVGIAAVALWRGVNLATLTPEQLGHVNAEGLIFQGWLVYTGTAIVVLILRRRLANHGWARLEWFRGLMRKNPAIVPVPMTLHEVAETHRALGAAVAEPPASYSTNP